MSDASGSDLPKLGIDPLPAVVAALTVDEKINLLVGTGMSLEGLPLPPTMRGPPTGTPPRIPGAGGMTHAVPRLGIPSIVLADGPAGLRIRPQRAGDPRRYHATAFPVATLLASSWDTALVERVGAAMGAEARDYGIDVLLAPALNIHRNPLGGRNFEYYSEDPLLSGRMAAAAIRGIQSTGVAATPKHLVANDHEWNRYTISVQADEQPLREIYLRAFEIAVLEGRPQALMSSYNKLNGVPTSQDPVLLEEVLRGEWGFDGAVMTDWFAGEDPLAQLRAGNDLLMPGTAMQQSALQAGVARGAVAAADLDRNVTRVLRLVLASQTFRGLQPSNTPDLTGHARLAREAAAAGMVLLRNASGALPLPAASRVALFGTAGYATIIGGTGSGEVSAAGSVSLADGLRAAGYGLETALAGGYRRFIEQMGRNQPARRPLEPAPRLLERRIEAAEIDAAAAAADVAVVTIGRRAGEFADLSLAQDFELQAAERELLLLLDRSFRQRGKPVVVVLNIGSVIETASWRDLTDAILLAWHPGQQAGEAIADVLGGRTPPTGRLATSFPLRWLDVPSSAGFPGRRLRGPDPAAEGILTAVDREAEVVYDDGLRVGYRHYAAPDGPGVAYAFGHGLSYTRFGYSPLQLDRTDFDGALQLRLTVTNQGSAAGREVVQLYVSPPAAAATSPPAAAATSRPALELRAFAKTPLLAPGQSTEVVFSLTARDLAVFEPTCRCWRVAAGSHALQVGASSVDIRQRAAVRVAQPLDVLATRARLSRGDAPR